MWICTNENPGGPFKDYVDFKIGYGASVETVRNFLQAVHKQASETGEGMDVKEDALIALKENEETMPRDGDLCTF